MKSTQSFYLLLTAFYFQIGVTDSIPLSYNGFYCDDCNCAGDNMNSSCDYMFNVRSSGICNGQFNCLDWKAVGCKAEFDPDGSDRPIGSYCSYKPSESDNPSGIYRCIYYDQDYYPSDTMRCVSRNFHLCHEKEQGYDCSEGNGVKGSECMKYEGNSEKGMYCTTPRALPCVDQSDGTYCEYKYQSGVTYPSIHYWQSKCENKSCVDAHRAACMSKDEGEDCSYTELDERLECLQRKGKYCIKYKYELYRETYSGNCAGAESENRKCLYESVSNEELLDQTIVTKSSSSALKIHLGIVSIGLVVLIGGMFC